MATKTKGEDKKASGASEKAARPKKLLPNGCDPAVIGKATQIKPGEVRNPGGRPKKKPITSAYARLLSDEAKADKLAEALFNQALTGNVPAAKELREGIEGKAMQAIRMDGELGITTLEERKKRMVDILRKAAERIEANPVGGVQ